MSARLVIALAAFIAGSYCNKILRVAEAASETRNITCVFDMGIDERKLGE